MAGKDALPKDDLENNGAIINGILKGILTTENWLSRSLRLPIGVSAFVVANKPEA
jgi:hypothetical protein